MIIFLCVLMGIFSSLEASYLFRNGKLTKTEEVATLSVQEHYGGAMEAFQSEQWDELVRHMIIVIKNFPTSPFAQEAYYYLGVGYFHLQEYDFSNRFFTQYLKKEATPKFFEEAVQYKYQIAKEYQSGAKRHVLGIEAMPKWMPAQDEAIAIYDEVVTALPHHDLAAHALFGKAKLLLEEEEYKTSIETYQTLIRRFPKHPLAVESYIGIGQVYLVQSQKQYPDQDYLDLAVINLNKFRLGFPGEERIVLAEKMLAEMREVFASDLYDTARFYERTKKPQAAFLYYSRVLAKYPETDVAVRAARRMQSLPAPPQKESPTIPSSHEENRSILNLPIQPGLIVQADD